MDHDSEMVTVQSEIEVFQCQIQSAMKNLFPWEALVALMEDLSTGFEIAKSINHILLDELKLFKHPETIIQGDSSETIKVELDDNDFKTEIEDYDGHFLDLETKNSRKQRRKQKIIVKEEIHDNLKDPIDELRIDEPKP